MTWMIGFEKMVWFGFLFGWGVKEERTVYQIYSQDVFLSIAKIN